MSLHTDEEKAAFRAVGEPLPPDTLWSCYSCGGLHRAAPGGSGHILLTRKDKPALKLPTCSRECAGIVFDLNLMTWSPAC